MGRSNLNKKPDQIQPFSIIVILNAACQTNPGNYRWLIPCRFKTGWQDAQGAIKSFWQLIPAMLKTGKFGLWAFGLVDTGKSMFNPLRRWLSRLR